MPRLALLVALLAALLALAAAVTREEQEAFHKKILSMSAKAMYMTPEVQEFMDRLGRDESAIQTAQLSLWKLLRKTADPDSNTPLQNSSVTVFLSASMLAKAPFVQREEKPVKFVVEDVVPAVQELLLMMKPGDRIQAWIPTSWAYGSGNSYGVATPGSLFTVDIELVRIGSMRGRDPDYTQPPFFPASKKQAADREAGKGDL